MAADLIPTLLSAAIATPLCVLTATFAAEVLAGLPGSARRGEGTPPATPGPRTVVVMPANNEAAVIARTLERLVPELPAGVRVLVVADNCTDDTAAIATQTGVEVIRRDDRKRRGKGYALAFARDHLADGQPPEVVVVLDADGATDRASLQSLARAARTGPAQAVNLLRPDHAAAPMVQVSNFAFVIKNLVRQRGLSRLAGRVALTGTGMAFPWPIYRDAPLATWDIVEDLALGLDLARRGAPPRFAADATVWSEASSATGTLQQRTRWEGGFLSTARRRALPQIAAALRARSGRELWAGLSLAVPPLTLLLMADGAGLAVGALLTLVGASAWPAAILATLLAVALAALTIAWRRIGRPFLSARAAIFLPGYLLWKVPVYLRVLSRRPTGWLRPGR